MIIRSATEKDIEAIKQLFWELDTDAIKHQPEHFQRGDRNDESLMEMINGPKSQFLLAELHDEVVGFSLLFEKETNGPSLLIPCRYAYMQDFIVKEIHRNCGIGTRLFEASKQWAKDRGLDYLRLSVFPSNDNGIRFYKRQGLQEQMVSMECHL